MTEEVELKACPFCGEKTFRINSHHIYPNGEKSPTSIKCLGCNFYLSSFESDEDCIKRWNTRPLEDALLKRAEEAEAIINGMFPMWISAMAYCEHGKKDDLMRMKNYYNGRDNPLTAEQLGALFEIQKTPEALKNE